MTERSLARAPISRRTLLAIWVVLTIAMAVVVPRLPWGRAAAEVAGVKWSWLVLAVALNATILPLWALEWRLLVPAGFRVRLAAMFEIVAITAAVLNSVPMLAGEASAVVLLRVRAGLSYGAALSVLALDQLLVAIAKVGVLVAAALLAPIPRWLQGGLLTLSVLLLGMLAALLALAHRWQSLSARVGTRDSIAGRVATGAIRWGRYLDALRDARLSAGAIALALAKKGAEVAAVLAVQTAFGVPPSVSVALMVVAALALSTLVPVAPANLGIYEATVFAVYTYAGMEPEKALVLAIAQHMCFLLPFLATGWIALTLRQFRSASRPSG